MPSSQTHKLSFKNVGAPNVPQEIKRLRRQNMDYQRRLGESTLHKHMWNNDDLDSGVAKVCPACFDEAYGQVRNDCNVCFGIRLVSVEDDPNLYIDSNGYTTTTPTAIHAPLYGGFAQAFLTWVVEPDAADDFFRINAQGVLTRVKTSQAQAPWYPDMNDNDLLINVNLGANDYDIEKVNDRYQLKQSNPQSIRMRGGRGAEKRYQIGQVFEMVLVPPNNILQQVPVDLAP